MRSIRQQVKMQTPACSPYCNIPHLKLCWALTLFTCNSDTDCRTDVRNCYSLRVYKILLQMKDKRQQRFSTKEFIIQNTATENWARRLNTRKHFTFMLPYILIDLFLNNQPDAPIIQIYSVMNLYMFRPSSLPIIRIFLLYIRHC
jgi:hypothetical protein